MHCNPRPPDVAPVVLRFNYEVPTKFEVGSTYPFLTAETLRYAVTLTLTSDRFQHTSGGLTTVQQVAGFTPL